MIGSVTPYTSRTIPPITFTDEDFMGIAPDQDDSMVITVEVANYVVKTALVD